MAWRREVEDKLIKLECQCEYFLKVIRDESDNAANDIFVKFFFVT